MKLRIPLSRLISRGPYGAATFRPSSLKTPARIGPCRRVRCRGIASRSNARRSLARPQTPSRRNPGPALAPIASRPKEFRHGGPGLRGLHVNYAPVRVHDALVHHFGQRRVREDAMDEFLLGGLQVHGDHVALDELRHLGANHMGPEQLSRRLVEHCLYNATATTE